jgi:WD40 repeat protein
MLLLDDHAADTQALIAEARARTRRRRARRAGVLVLIAAVVAIAGLTRGGSGDGVVSETASRPFVNVRAFAKDGELAFVSRGALWVLDGPEGSLRRVPTPRGLDADDPRFSPNGRWLAYAVSHGTGLGAGAVGLWIAHANGTGAHPLVVPSFNSFAGWSPTADLLAVTISHREPFPPYPTVTGLELLTPAGASRTVLELHPTRRHPDSIWDTAWSPDGRSIAVSTNDPEWDGGGSVIRSYPIDGAAPTTWFSIGTRQRARGVYAGRCTGEIADLAAWSPSFGMLYWVYACGATHNNDETPLEAIARPGAAPRLLTQTLSDGVTDAITLGSGGRLAVVTSYDGGRELGYGKTVARCSAASLTCTPLPDGTVWLGPNAQRCPTRDNCLPFAKVKPGHPGSGVSLDPAWSPNGSLLAYVRAPVALTDGWSPAAWFTDHALYVWNPHSDATRRLGAISGAQVPTWARNARQLLYVANDGLWLISAAAGGKPTEIAHPLFQPAGLYTTGNEDYYHQVPWGAQFSWSSP